MPQPELDPLLHQPIRTRLTAYLAARGEATFRELKQTLEVTDGNLEGHIKKLVAAGYLETQRLQGKGRPQTRYLLSATGQRAFEQYIQSLQALFPGLEGELENGIAPSLQST